jgi:hypothetical protein
MVSTVFLVFLFLGLSVTCARGDPITITAAEYFFDTDPGIGLGTPLSITPGTEVSIFGNSSAALLRNGMHTLYVRYRDSQAHWSVVKGKPFRVLSEGLLSEAEYFYDTDPGLGLGIRFRFNPDTVVSIFGRTIASSLQTGVHTFYYRLQDSQGRWSVVNQKKFRVSYQPVFTNGEVFFDSDPGVGHGIALRAEDGLFNEPEENMYRNVLADTIPLGQHNVGVRVRSSLGMWSFLSTDSVTIDQDGFFKTITSVMDTTSHPVRLVWPNIGAEEYHVFYDSLAHGSFTNFYTIAAPETSLVVNTAPGHGFYRVTGFWDNDSR